MHAHAELRKAKWQDHGCLLQEKLWLAQIIRCVQYADCPMMAETLHLIMLAAMH